MSDFENHVFLGSCERMAEIPDGVVQTCVTSPPYFGLRDYGVEGQIGLEETVDAFIDRLVGVFREVKRVLRDDGTLWLNLGDSYAGSPTTGFRPGSGRADGEVDERGQRNRNGVGAVSGLKPKDLIGVPWAVAFALRADGWWLRDAIVWHKPNPMPSSVEDRCTPSYEFVFLLAKSARYFYDADAIREPLAEATLDRIAQAKWKAGTQAGSDRANGGEKTNGPMKAVYRHNEARVTSQESGNRVWDDDEAMARMIDAGANKRNVWTIATTPYSDAHFATFPIELPSLCIRAGSSEAGCCSECRAPYKRTVNVDYDTQGRTTNGPRSTANRDFSPGVEVRAVKHVTTTGFEPTCEHDAPAMPCLVLDPFMGSGTVAEAATALGRRFTGYELNPEYHKLIAARTRQTGLFA
jgi:DNA modification methylase